jgi:hypothetical protein
MLRMVVEYGAALIRTLALIAAIAVAAPHCAVAKCPQPVQGYPPVFLPVTPALPVGPLGSSTNPYLLNTPASNLPSGSPGWAINNGNGGLSIPPGTTYFAFDPAAMGSPAQFDIVVRGYNASNQNIRFSWHTIDKATGNITNDVSIPLRSKAIIWGVTPATVGVSNLSNYIIVLGVIAPQGASINVWAN